MTIDTEEQLEGLKLCGEVVRRTLDTMAAALVPGITTRELDDIGREVLDRAGAVSAPEATYRFPGATCISVNEVCAHGIPGEYEVQAGDLINIDVSAELDGYWTDTGASYIVPPVRPDKQLICEATRLARDEAIRAVSAGCYLNVIGKKVEEIAAEYGLSVIENLSSHGVGSALHEEPKEIPSYFDPSDTRRLHEGAVITIEPFLSNGARWVDQKDDGWSLFTPPGFLAAQYEHTLVVTKSEPIIIT